MRGFYRILRRRHALDEIVVLIDSLFELRDAVIRQPVRREYAAERANERTRRREQCEAMLKQNGLWNQR